jgi:aryl-phospho-beta-D-glucosidase BglC (GH1 family)
MIFKPAFVIAALSIPLALCAPSQHVKKSSYVDWKTFKAYGVNLGGWLVQESTIDTDWWAQYSGGASDEWGLCKHLGSRCGAVLENRYATFITTADIDKAALAGITLLRIPTTYAAWIKYPGTELYSGNQQRFLTTITQYAITKYGMHIVLDVHGLPGGINGLTIGEAEGHYGWFNNQTNFDYSMQVIDAMLSFIQNSGHPESFSLEPINEASDNPDLSKFGTPATLSSSGASWVLKYFTAVVARVAAVNRQIPVMLQDCFQGEAFWSKNFASTANIAFDSHNYYFAGRETTSQNLPSFICSDAKASAGDGKFPVFVGEWSIQALYNNTFQLRERNLNTGIAAFYAKTQGEAYWTWKFSGNATVDGQGTQADYWSYETFADKGFIHPNSGGYTC